LVRSGRYTKAIACPTPAAQRSDLAGRLERAGIVQAVTLL
jgi:hypothetical protein